jgi:hypothetical protein
MIYNVVLAFWVVKMCGLAHVGNNNLPVSHHRLPEKPEDPHQQCTMCFLKVRSRSAFEDDCLLGCCAMKSGRSLPTFQRCLLPQSSR